MSTQESASKTCVRERSREVLATTTVDSAVVPVRGEGVRIQDADGQWLWDFHSGVGVNNLGYGEAVQPIMNAMVRHLRTVGASHFMTNDFDNPWATTLAEQLSRITPGNPAGKKVFLCNSGTEATEAAYILLQKNRPARRVFLAFHGCFHGRTGFAKALDEKEVRTRDLPCAYEVIHIPFPHAIWRFEENGTPIHWSPEEYMTCVSALIAPRRDAINALFAELVQGEGGIYPADSAYLHPLVEYLRAHNIKIVADEIQTGFGRTGALFASDRYGLIPDVMALGKAIAGGLPLGAIVFDRKLDWKELGEHSNTFGGNTLACVAAMKTMELAADRFPDSSLTDQYLYGELNYAIRSINAKCSHTRLVNLRGMGWMLGIDVLAPNEKTGAFEFSPARRKQIVRCAEENGLWLIGCGRAGIRFMPPIIIARDEIDEAMKIFKRLPVWD